MLVKLLEQSIVHRNQLIYPYRGCKNTGESWVRLRYTGEVCCCTEVSRTQGELVGTIVELCTELDQNNDLMGNTLCCGGSLPSRRGDRNSP